MSILKTAPADADVLDLAVARAVRAEARAAAGKGKSFIKLTVGFVEVRAEIPLSVAIDLQSEKLEQGLAGLLADPADIVPLLSELTANDVEELTKFITGTSLGE